MTLDESPVGAETQLLRTNTDWFIAADPVVLVLTPSGKVSDGAGGYTPAPGEPRAEQIFRLIPSTDSMPQIQTPDGVQLTPTYVLLGSYDAEMERWDTFSLNGVDFRIVSPIRPDHRTPEHFYEKKADVARL